MVLPVGPGTKRGTREAEIVVSLQFFFCFVFGLDWGKKPARNLSIILSLLILNGCQMTNALLFSHPVIFFFFESTLGVYLLLLQCCVDKTMKNCPKELISLRRITLKRSKAQNAN